MIKGGKNKSKEKETNNYVLSKNFNVYFSLSISFFRSLPYNYLYSSSFSFLLF